MMSDFATRLIAWQKQHGRHHLPWQGQGAYQVWLSEIMLQQTQVVTVIPYYQRFVESFPTVQALADAPLDDVLAHWSGLGYYARARNLHKAAQQIVALHQAAFPREFEQVLALPGVGRSTAAAICAFAYQQNRAILDGNVKRVLARYCGIEGVPNDKTVEAKLWLQAEALLPAEQVNIYTQALMDMGSMLCTRSKPQCAVCPVQSDCNAYQTQRVAQLPTPRPKRAQPEKHATFHVLLHNDEVLLEQRPAVGIWGGLWCVPENLSLQHWSVKQQDLLPTFTHVFTHFKLHITPQCYRLTRKPDAIQSSNQCWMPISAALQSGIPTPLRRILLGLPEASAVA